MQNENTRGTNVVGEHDRDGGEEDMVEDKYEKLGRLTLLLL